MTNSSVQAASQTSLLNASLLVAGTCIGGGMLALPVVSGQTGFIPSTSAMFFIWIAMTCTALCLVELCLWLGKKNGHIISLAEAYLGKWGRYVAWILFLFMSYASIIAYIAGSGHLLAQGISTLGLFCSKEVGCITFTLIFAPFVFLPHTKLATLNSVLFYIMIGAFFFIVLSGVPHVQQENLTQTDWGALYKAVPLLLTSFSFQTMVPSLAPLLGYDRKKLWLACCIGTFISLLIYCIWQWVVLGAVPLMGEHGLLAAYTLGEPATYSLSKIAHIPILAVAAPFFAFFALVTSFLGLALGLFDFLSDGCQIAKHTPKGRVLLTLLVLVPSLFFSLYFERAFLLALDLSGGFGDTLLNGCLPLLMLGAGSTLYFKKKNKKLSFLYAGMAFVGLIFALSFACEMYARFTIGETIYDNKATDIIEMENKGVL